MNALDRYEQRKAQLRTLENNPEDILGQTVAKSLIGILDADKEVRRFGWLKDAFRVGTAALLGAKVTSEITAATAEVLSGNFGLDDNIRTYELNGGWVALAATALYGISRVLHSVQNSHHRTAMSRRDEFRKRMVEGQKGIDDGAINVIGDYYDLKTIAGLTQETSTSMGDPMENFLYKTKPTIPMPDGSFMTQVTNQIAE